MMKMMVTDIKADWLPGPPSVADPGSSRVRPVLDSFQSQSHLSLQLVRRAVVGGDDGGNNSGKKISCRNGGRARISCVGPLRVLAE